MKKYKIITPTGNIFVRTAAEAIVYKTLYGYPYIKIKAENVEKIRKELQDKIDRCNGDMFLAYGYIKQLEELNSNNSK